MGPPFATGLGTVGVLLLLGTFAFSATPFVLIPAVLMLAFAAVLFFSARAASTETQPDPVTGGRRWWQKRWDE
jgi:hypothetical protein